jgi:hypothetical protein
VQAERSADPARLNDLAPPKSVNAAGLATSGIATGVAEAPDTQITLVRALAELSQFDADDDPYGERDFGAFEL